MELSRHREGTDKQKNKLVPGAEFKQSDVREEILEVST